MQSGEGRFSDLGPRSPFNPISNNYMNINTVNNNQFPNINNLISYNSYNYLGNNMINMNNNNVFDNNMNNINNINNNNIGYNINNNNLNNPQYSNINRENNPFQNHIQNQKNINLMNQNDQNYNFINNNISQINRINNNINYHIIRCGNKFNNNEINIIINSSFEEYRRKKDPLSKWIIQRIKNILGGDWVVFICAIGLKGYDLSVSINDENRYISFIIDNFKFQIIKIKD